MVSNWESGLSGVPQGSVLGLILFLIYINYLDDDITSKVLTFADDTIVFRNIKSVADKQQLQDDLNKYLHTGHGNEDAQYKNGWSCTKYYHKRKGLRVNY